MLSKDELNTLKPGDLIVFEVLREDQGFLREGRPQPELEYHVSFLVGTVQRNDFVDFDLQPIYNGKMYHKKYFLREDTVRFQCEGKLDGFLSEERKKSILEKSESQRANIFNNLVKDTPYLQAVLSNPRDSIIHPSELIKEPFIFEENDERFNADDEKNASSQIVSDHGFS